MLFYWCLIRDELTLCFASARALTALHFVQLPVFVKPVGNQFLQDLSLVSTGRVVQEPLQEQDQQKINDASSNLLETKPKLNLCVVFCSNL